MAAISIEGFETGSVTQSSTIATGGGGFQFVTGRDGIGVAIRGGSGTVSSTVTRLFSSESDIIYVHLGVFISSTQFGLTLGQSPILYIQADNGAVSHLSVTFDATGHAQLRRGQASATILATSANAISADAWRSVEFKARIHDTLGEFILKFDGTEYINFTGDTKNGGTSTRPDRLVLITRTSPQGHAWDDLFICDTSGMENNTWTGEVSITGIKPAGNGANSDLVGSDGNSVDNYLQVDEYPLNTSDYNASTTTGDLDTYDMSAVGKIGTVLAVQDLTYAAKSDSGPKSFKHVMRASGGTMVKSDEVALSTTYSLYAGPIWITDGDGEGWTITKVNSHEFGFEVV